MASENYTLGKGELHFSLFRTGTYVPEGFRYLGLTPEFALTIETEYLDLMNSDHGIREKVRSVPIETTRSGNFTCVDMEQENLANFFFGSTAIATQTALATQSETITDVIPGLAYQVGLSDTFPTGIHSLTSVVVKVGVTTMTLDTDYSLNAELGIVTVIDGGAIVIGDDIIVEYDRSAKSRKEVISGTEPVSGALRFIADNPEGDNLDFYFPYVRLSPNGDFSLKTEEWQTLPFSLEILKRTTVEAIYIDGRPYTP